MNPNDDMLDGEYLNEPLELDVPGKNAGERLDVFAARESGETRAFIHKRIDSGEVRVNGGQAKAGLRLREGDTVTMRFEPPQPIDLVPEDIPLDIVYEDHDIAVINKPKGMVVHPAPGNEHGTLVNAVMYCIKDLSGIGGELRPGIVHRLDKLTSGLIVIAKNDMAHRSIASQLKVHSAGRMYIALVDDNIREDAGTVDAPIGRHHTDRKRMAVVYDGTGRDAVTHWRVIERYGAYTLIGVMLETGRTHQIRVHMASIKHPVAGDAVYGSQRNPLSLDGQALHAARLSLTHPRSGERMTFCAPVPDYFLKALLRAGRADTTDIEKLVEECFNKMRND